MCEIWAGCKKPSYDSQYGSSRSIQDNVTLVGEDLDLYNHLIFCFILMDAYDLLKSSVIALCVCKLILDGNEQT